MSQITGASVESLSTLGYAAARSQVEVESLYAGIEKMNKFLGEATAGSAEANQALARLGLSVGQLQGMSPDEQFRTLADALSRVSSQAERTALATAVFGRGAFDLLPLLNQGGAGIRGLEQDLRDMGGEVTAADAQLGREFLRNINSITKAFQYAALAVGRALLPALVDATSWMRDVAKVIGTVAGGVVAWVKENKALVTTVVLVAGGVVALGTAIVGDRDGDCGGRVRYHRASWRRSRRWGRSSGRSCRPSASSSRPSSRSGGRSRGRGGAALLHRGGRGGDSTGSRRVRRDDGALSSKPSAGSWTRSRPAISGSRSGSSADHPGRLDEVHRGVEVEVAGLP
jgi:hypothetical protein